MKSPNALKDAVLVIRRRIELRGTVQGVGFRPFVYNLASALGVSGFVMNTGRGVTIEAQASAGTVDEFLERLRTDAPVLASVELVGCSDMPVTSDGAGFSIAPTPTGANAFALVPPDIATCDHCWADFTDPANRRFEYPFTNCTNCGPRYTIIRQVPYDRPSTTMSEFKMCALCEREYRDPSDRRFHAQPNACPVCGPWVELWDRERRLAERGDAVARVRELLTEGAIVAIKGLGGFHIACDAGNEAAVRCLRDRKRRTDKPFAVMAPDMETVEACCEISRVERAVLTGPTRPIVLLERRDGSVVSEAVAPGNHTLGVMLPYTPLHHLLFSGKRGYQMLVMTSGNLSEEPIASRNDEVPARLHPLCDYFLLHNRDIQTRVDDSVVRVFRGAPVAIRRSRAYAPQPIDLDIPVREILAVGGELKNTFCLTKDHYAILSQHIGDLENHETLAFFREALAHVQAFFDVHPEAVAHDLHPGYLSTRFAETFTEIPPVGVQHHHAHVAACMAEHSIREKVIGVAFDGTGYGTDGKIWGGEVLVADWGAFERRAHFRYVPMAGGDAAVRQPWRMALSYLRDAFGENIPEIPALAGISESTRRVINKALANRINTVETSSCGRLFDAVAALAGVRVECNYEGQAAMELEAIAATDAAIQYPFDFDGEEIDWRAAIRAIVEDIRAGTPASVISARFHNAVSASIVEACRRVRAQDGLRRVCLTGGSFQNWRLLQTAVEGLEQAGFSVYWHRRVPPNDGGLALGQAVVANAVVSV